MTRALPIPPELEPLIDAFADDQAVTVGPSLTTSTLKVGGMVFALVSGGRLVVKLPQEDVDLLVSLGRGARYKPRVGRAMKEWIVLATLDCGEQLEAARKARCFVEAECRRVRAKRPAYR